MNKKILKYVSVLSLIVVFAVVLSGCAQSGVQHAPTSGPYAFIYKWLGVPFQNLILATAKHVGGRDAYAWGIMIISFVVRLLLLPLSLNQQYKSTAQQEKMRAIQPQLKLIQEKQKEAKDPATQQKISQLMMDVYKQNNISLTGGIGCLPLLLQMPILIAIYQAVQYSQEIGVATFLSIPLGKPSLVIALVATVFYVIQSWLSLQIVPQEQRRQMSTMLLMNPLITFFISMISSAALALYFLVGGIVILIQQLITNYIITPRIRKQADANLEKNPVKIVVTEESIAKLMNESGSSNSSNGNSDDDESHTDLHKNIRELNKGKQQKPKDK
ncbi:membrane protein insertase YidC [Companilactobacillus sp.]|uniref:membrane protein insertase YidC n=1 Tax=Companilactobacillus sp. TaxID=2767905 RepID=UPI0025C48CD3|nr:membrane protein insertase YidC [Companilactobacillus sp.]MCH4007997.1 membrane protein insertase YidC [Companilactobacillus sp.]MCH4051824.1 membrane protein insertase YidC [Companilactobacillus sp.]MCH4075940.1 membrane protein insertase YidC [Companilactobacillus sp.]MCH4124515.1 membrane protein insertase YidC [Companilactobacillus sp.]MCH4132522.1 membrane protein insertase YidC [Companilactobacillus sp.]